MRARLDALGPLDGRYREQTADLRERFSERALIRLRVHVEVEWLIALGDEEAIAELPPLDAATRGRLRELAERFSPSDAERVAGIEAVTDHDVKAVEYFIKERIAELGLDIEPEWVHFACTSEDINNLAYALMLRDGLAEVWEPAARRLVEAVREFALDTAAVPMLAHTHGQPATPTTFGKELAVFVARWERQLRQLESAEHLGKLNGATGTYSAHVVAYPDAPWLELSRRFVEGLGLTWNPLTTQVESHDAIADHAHRVMRFNAITTDFVRDMWAYVSLGYLRQRPTGTVGSSTMPHKINPIKFENAEANLGMSNAVLGHLAGTLTTSRLQRDLTDSSALRNLGVGLGHAVTALRSALRGVRTADVDATAMAADLDDAWAVLGEAVQTVLRKNGADQPYETIKQLTRGRTLTAAGFHEFVAGLDIDPEDRERLEALAPSTYTGLAPQLARLVGETVESLSAPRRAGEPRRPASPARP